MVTNVHLMYIYLERKKDERGVASGSATTKGSHRKLWQAGKKQKGLKTTKAGGQPADVRKLSHGRRHAHGPARLGHVCLHPAGPSCVREFISTDAATVMLVCNLTEPEKKPLNLTFFPPHHTQLCFVFYVCLCVCVRTCDCCLCDLCHELDSTP